MIAWYWLIPTLLAGATFGFLLCAGLVIDRESEQIEEAEHWRRTAEEALRRAAFLEQMLVSDSDDIDIR